MSTGVFMIALCLVMTLITVLSDIIVLEYTNDVTLIMVECLFMVFAVMVSVYLPLAFKFGYIKAAGINRFILLGLTAFIGVITAVLAAVLKNKEESDIPRKLAALNLSLSSMNVLVILGCFVLFVLIIYLASMRISIKFFRKRVLF